MLRARHRSELASCGSPLLSSSLFAKGPLTHSGRTEPGDRLVFQSGGCDERGRFVGTTLGEDSHGWNIMNSSNIVVGVDESPESRWAVLWAAGEARLRSATLTLAHVSSSVNEDRAADHLANQAETLLMALAAEASELEPGIAITPRLYESKSVSKKLTQLSGAATLLTLGVNSARPRANHGLLGPIEDRVVASARCPVVTVNGPSPIVGRAYDKIVVGWTWGTTGRRALQAAAEEAALRRSLLSIVTIPPTSPPSEQMNVEQVLIDSIRGIETTYPGLRIDLTHRSGHVVTELERALERAALLVLGCHHSEQPWSIRLGPVAEESMRFSRCPVMLVGRRGREGTN